MSRFSNSKNNFFKPSLQKCKSISKAQTIIHKPDDEIIENINEIIKLVDEITTEETKTEEIKIEEELKPSEIEKTVEIKNEINPTCIPLESVKPVEEKSDDMTITFNEIYYQVAENESFSEANPTIAVKKTSKKDLFKLVVEQVILNKKKENINGWVI